MDDPHRSLTGSLASLMTSYTKIKLLGMVHYLNDFEKKAFPYAFSNTDPKKPFNGLPGNREIIKLII